MHYIRDFTVLQLLPLLLVHLVVVVVMMSTSGDAYMWGADATKRLGIPPDCHCPGTHL